MLPNPKIERVHLDDALLEHFSEEVARSILDGIGVQDPDIRRMRWFFFYFTMVWLLAGMTLTIIAYCATQNLGALSLFVTIAPPAFIQYRIVKYLFPWNGRDYELAIKQIESLSFYKNNNKDANK